MKSRHWLILATALILLPSCSNFFEKDNDDFDALQCYITENFEKINEKLDELESKTDALETQDKLDGIESKISDVESKVEDIDSKIEDIKLHFNIL